MKTFLTSCLVLITIGILFVLVLAIKTLLALKKIRRDLRAKRLGEP